jgi:hypothetical protein
MSLKTAVLSTDFGIQLSAYASVGGLPATDWGIGG